MMGIQENNTIGQNEREVQMWCKIKKFPYELFLKLSPADKITFYKLTCQPESMTTTKQREDLFNNLLSTGTYVAARGSFDPRELIIAEKKEQFFSPITSEEKYDYFSRF